MGCPTIWTEIAQRPGTSPSLDADIFAAEHGLKPSGPPPNHRGHTDGVPTDGPRSGGYRSHTEK
jgi:hypothetical protein